MKELISIKLQNVRFYAFHGLQPEERRSGNEFEVNLQVDILPLAGTVTAIDETINYESLFRILQNEMRNPRNLLETLSMEIAEQVHQQFPSTRKIMISISKLDPPIAQFTGSVAVTYIKEY